MACEALIDLKSYQEASDSRRFVLFYATLLHDIAKPGCTIVQPDGRITSAGHSKRGATDARILLWQAEVPFLLRERICGIIGSHQVPFHAINGARSGLSPEFIVRKLSWELNLEELSTVAEADALGRWCADNQATLDNIELFRELAREEGCLETPRGFADEHTRLMYFRSQGSFSPDYPIYQDPGSKVTVMSGLPASGKNTWVENNAKHLPVVSFDDARMELGLKHGPRSGAAVHLAIDRAKEFLRHQQPFIWNATHLSAQMRTKTLDLLFNYNAEVEIVYLEAPEKILKSRNAKRDTTLTNAAIDKMLYRWEIPQPTEAHRIRYLAETDRLAAIPEHETAFALR